MGDFSMEFLQLNKGILLNSDCISLEQKIHYDKESKNPWEQSIQAGWQFNAGLAGVRFWPSPKSFIGMLKCLTGHKKKAYTGQKERI